MAEHQAGELRTFGVSIYSLEALGFPVSKGSSTYLHRCLGRDPRPDNAFYLLSELLTESIEADSMAQMRWGPGIC